MAGTRAFFFRHGHARGGGLRHGAKEPAGKKTARLGRRPPGRPAMGCTDMLGGRRATTGLEEGTARGPPARRESGRGPSLVGAARAAEPRGDPPAALAQGAEVPGRSFMPCFLETTTFSGAPSTILPSSSSLHFCSGRSWETRSSRKNIQGLAVDRGARSRGSFGVLRLVFPGKKRKKSYCPSQSSRTTCAQLPGSVTGLPSRGAELSARTSQTDPQHEGLSI
ncbi:unnamed protein product [Prorocentrum cordatum]|uniref:Uncharacterized protein n=1 Tax=Prorocentrum cordatum TaxID=2364126 RepID=A0ABN9VLA8_9DINO|nr:unnamed protein product [Polarella glacialis]